MDNQLGPHHSSVNLRSDGGRLGDLININKTGIESLRSPQEGFPPLPQAPMNLFSREQIVNETPDLMDQIAIQCWAAGRAAAEAWGVVASFCSRMVVRAVYTVGSAAAETWEIATSFCGRTVTRG